MANAAYPSSSFPASSRNELGREASTRSLGSQSSSNRKKRKQKRSQISTKVFGVSRSEIEALPKDTQLLDSNSYHSTPSYYVGVCWRMHLESEQMSIFAASRRLVL